MHPLSHPLPLNRPQWATLHEDAAPPSMGPRRRAEFEFVMRMLSIPPQRIVTVSRESWSARREREMRAAEEAKEAEEKARIARDAERQREREKWTQAKAARKAARMKAKDTAAKAARRKARVAGLKRKTSAAGKEKKKQKKDTTAIESLLKAAAHASEAVSSEICFATSSESDEHDNESNGSRLPIGPRFELKAGLTGETSVKIFNVEL